MLKILLGVLWRFLGIRLTDLLWVVFWLVLLPAVLAAGQEASDEGCILPSRSVLFAADQGWCFDMQRPPGGELTRYQQFYRCDQRLIEMYSGEKVSYDEYAGAGSAARSLPRFRWPSFPTTE